LTLVVRAVAAFLALPLLVAFVLPVWIGTATGRSVRYLMPGLVLAFAGSLLLRGVREFYVAGRGSGRTKLACIDG